MKEKGPSPVLSTGPLQSTMVTVPKRLTSLVKLSQETGISFLGLSETHCMTLGYATF